MEKYIGKYIRVVTGGFVRSALTFKLDAIKDGYLLSEDVVYIKCPIKWVKSIREATEEEIELLKY